MTELQQSKYQDLQAGLPSELSMQLAEVALALGSAEDQVTSLGHRLTVYLILVSCQMGVLVGVYQIVCLKILVVLVCLNVDCL